MKYVFILVVQVFFVISLVAQKSTFEKTGTLNIDKLKQAMPEYKTSSVLRTLKETVSDIEVRYYKSD